MKPGIATSSGTSSNSAPSTIRSAVTMTWRAAWAIRTASKRGPTMRAFPSRAASRDVDDRDVGNERGDGDNGLTGVGIDDGLEAADLWHIRALHARDRHEGDTLDRGAQTGDDAVAGVLPDLQVAALDGAPVARSHPE